jgi:hypothetical protein
MMDTNSLNRPKIIVSNKRLERKPRQNYRQTLATLKSIVEETDKLYNQFDSQEQALKKRISTCQDWVRFWTRGGNLSKKEKSLMYYIEDISHMLIRISEMKNLEEKERLLYYLKVEISLETLQNEKRQKKTVLTITDS